MPYQVDRTIKLPPSRKWDELLRALAMLAEKETQVNLFQDLLLHDLLLQGRQMNRQLNTLVTPQLMYFLSKQKFRS